MAGANLAMCFTKLNPYLAGVAASTEEVLRLIAWHDEGRQSGSGDNIDARSVFRWSRRDVAGLVDVVEQVIEGTGHLAVPTVEEARAAAIVVVGQLQNLQNSQG